MRYVAATGTIHQSVMAEIHHKFSLDRHMYVKMLVQQYSSQARVWNHPRRFVHGMAKRRPSLRPSGFGQARKGTRMTNDVTASEASLQVEIDYSSPSMLDIGYTQKKKKHHESRKRPHAHS